MPALPFYSQIKTGIDWYLSEADFANKNGRGKPGDHLRPFKPWRDKAALPVAAGWNFWSTPVRDLEYQFIARNPDGSVKLTPVDSPEFLRTYTSLSVVGAYRERKFHPSVSRGVPYLVTSMVTADNWDLNLYSDSGRVIDYPIELRPDIVLIADPSQPGGVVAWQYQEFMNATKAPAADATQTKKRLMEMAAFPMTDEEFCLGAIVLLQSWQQPLPVPPARTLI